MKLVTLNVVHPQVEEAGVESILALGDNFEGLPGAFGGVYGIYSEYVEQAFHHGQYFGHVVNDQYVYGMLKNGKGVIEHCASRQWSDRIPCIMKSVRPR
jgi:hypothetical protein